MAQQYKLIGVINVSAIVHTSLLALGEGNKILSKENLLLGIKEEFNKEERQFTAI